jgi:hypothetical protein
MPYKTDGSVHHGGVRNEHSTAELFNKCPPKIIQDAYLGKTLTFVHLGGTQTVDDIGVIADGERVSGISTKRHLGSGTYDYINTSKITDYIPSAIETTQKLREIRREHYGNPESVNLVRDTVKNMILNLWATLQSEYIRQLLQNTNERNSEWISIVSSSECVTFSHAALKELSEHPYDPDTLYEIRASRASGSRQIWRIKNGIETNTHLRVRIVLNNGIRALIGLSTANKDSILTLKIQQDNVNALLKTIQP